MEITQMRYLRAIVQYGGFSEAAVHLHVTQPALSKSISKLEDEMGVPLFVRKGNRTTLTRQGKILLGYCATVLDTIESGIGAVKESVGLKRGRLTIAISEEMFVKNLIYDFLSRNPEVSFTCHLMSQQEMVRALEEGTVDFVLSGQPVQGENIDWQVIHKGHLAAVLSRSDPLLKKNCIFMEDLKDYWFCIGNLRTNPGSSVYQLCCEAGFQPKVRYEGYDPDMAGMLLGIPKSVIISTDSIDRSIRETGMKNQEYSSVPIWGTEGKAIIGVAARVGHYQSEAALAFYDMVVDYFK